jgi:hypothetical protein
MAFAITEIDMTHLELLDDTVEYYKKNRRSVKRTLGELKVCQYMGVNGAKCAVGKELDENHPNYAKIVSEYNELAADDLFAKFGNDILKERSQRITLRFWDQLQSFHDDDLNWVERANGTNELSQRGKNHYDEGKEIAEKMDAQG